MKNFITVAAFCLISFSLLGQSKKNFDLSSTSKDASDKLSMTNAISEMTLIKGGYFTVGTTGGMSSLSADDFNQVSFGHPYALTSFPLIYADNAWMKPSDLFSNQTQILSKTTDTLSVFFTDSLRYEALFMLIQKNSGGTIEFIFKLKNIDVVSHTLGLGYTYDPALGNNGDGFAEINSSFVLRDTILNSAIPTNLQLWERNTYPQGIGLELAFNSGIPTDLTLANWNDMQDGVLSSDENLRWIYDLCLQAFWDTQTVNPGEEIEYTLQMNFLQPEFSTDPFLRWDMPFFLSVEDSVLFPMDMSSYAEIFNTQASSISGLSVSLLDTDIVDDWTGTGTFTLNGASSKVVDVPVSVNECFHDTIIEVNLKLNQNGTEADLLKRKIYIPAAPYSDTGLDVVIDSVSTADYPTVKIFFEASNNETGQLLNNLKKTNVFPYEDNIDFSNFTLEKDTSGGVNEADIAIILDVTGSMSNEIADVRDNVIEFADSLVQNGIDVRLGMVTFRDVVEDIFPFTDDIISFQQNVSIQQADAGDDEPENSLEALHSGCQLIFRPEANRIFIWITDATYHIGPDQWTNLTVNDVITDLISNSVKVYAIAPAELQTQWFDQIVMNTGGDFYDINGNFRDVLLQISRMGGSSRYLLKYNSTALQSQPHTIKVEVHTLGKGGYDIAVVNFSSTQSFTSCYPNPSNNRIHMNVANPENKKCAVLITDETGRKLKYLDMGDSPLISWDCIINDLNGSGTIKPGIYFFNVSLTGVDNDTETEVVKVIFTN
jgi:hypothetical protein